MNTITLKLRSDTIEIPYILLKDGLCLHKAIDPNIYNSRIWFIKNCYNITHVESSMIVIPHMSLTRAKHAFVALLATGVNWKQGIKAFSMQDEEVRKASTLRHKYQGTLKHRVLEKIPGIEYIESKVV